GGDGGRADVDGDAEGALGEAGIDGDDVAALAHCGGRLPTAGAQYSLQVLERREICGRVDDAPLLCERLLQAAEVAGRLAQVRLADLDVMQPHDRVDLDRMLLGALAHHLPVDLALRRHVDDEVAADFRLAAEPPPLRELSALVAVALLDLVPWAGVMGARIDRVFGELPLGDLDLAAPADAAPAADRIEIDAERARRGEQARSLRDVAAFARRGEDDAIGAQRVSRSVASCLAPGAARAPAPLVGAGRGGGSHCAFRFGF